MSATVDSNEAIANDDVDQNMPEDASAAEAVPAHSNEANVAKVEDEVKLEATGDADVKLAEEEKTGLKQDVKQEDEVDSKLNGSAVKQEGAKDAVDPEDGRDDFENKNGDDKLPDSAADHKRKRAQDRDNADDHKRKKFGINKRSNIKSTFDDMTESQDHGEIRRQVEFYFSDSNLPIDKYLLELTGGHKNHPVDLKIIHSFKRMKHFQPFSELVKAVQSSDFLEINDKDEITRKTPLASMFGFDIDENKKLLHTDSMKNSIYAKGFGDEHATTHRDIEAFFEPYGPVKSIRLRRFEDNTFKGSVFVEFATQELQKQFLKMENKPQWEVRKDEMEDLDFMSKQTYVDTKHQGIVDGLVKPRAPRRDGFKNGRGGGKFSRGGKGGNNHGGKNHRGGRYDDRRNGRDDHRGGGDRKRRYDDRSRSRSRSRSRERFGGDGDDWRSRRDHDQKEDRRHGKRSRRDRDDEDDRRDHDDDDDRREAKRHEPEKEAKAVEAGAEKDE